MAEGKNGYAGLAWAGCCAALGAVLYGEALAYLWHQWGREDFSYGYLLPFVLGWLVWQKRAELGALPSRPSWGGVGAVALGVALYGVGELGGEFYTLDLSLWLTGAGFLWLALGRRKLRVVAFPVGLALMLFPPPNFLYTKLSFQLKLVSSMLGVGLIRVFGGSAYREGNIIDLGFTQLQVVDACSGLRYVFPLVVLALLMGYRRHRTVAKRAVLVLAAVPVAVLTNGGRIAGTAGLAAVFGPRVAEGAFHDVAGWALFLVSCGVLAAGSMVLGRVWPETPAPKAVLPPGGPPDGSRPLGWGPAAAAAALLAATVAVSVSVDFRERVPLATPLTALPLELGEWRGSREVMEPQFRRALFFRDYAMIDYRDARGGVVSLYVAWYDTQRKGEAIHSPETCLPGSGWVFRQAGEARLAVPGFRAATVPVHRAVLENAGQRGVVYFWFSQGGRMLTSLTQLKLHTFWHALTRRRTDGALVRLIALENASDAPGEAERRLQALTRLLVPVLDGALPR